jgi:hypothetical protein
MTILLMAVCLAASSALAMPSYNDVLLVVNSKSPESQEIGAYFKAARNIPDANVCAISVAPALGTGARMSHNDELAALSTIKNHLIKNGLTDKINYIVLTHGIPTYAYTGEVIEKIDQYHLFDVFLMYQLSESAANTDIPDIFTSNKYFYYNNVPNLGLYADAASGQNYIDFKDASRLASGDNIYIKDGYTAMSAGVVAVEDKGGYYRVTLKNNLYSTLKAATCSVIATSGNSLSAKKFSKTQFGYYIVGRLDGLGTATVKSMIDNTGASAYDSYRKQANGKMKLLTITPYFRQEVIDEINRRGNIEIASPNPVPPDVWNGTTTTLVDNTDSTITTSFDKVAKDTMFCFLNDVAWDSFFQWPQGNSYYAGGDFVQEYPFISRGATFLPGSIMMVYRSFPAAYDSHGNTGGIQKINVSTKAKTSYVKLDGSDSKFRHMTCVEYDPVNNQLWAGTGRDVFDVQTGFYSTCTDAVHRATMLNDGTGIAVYDADGKIVKYINANDADAGSTLKNNRVVKLVYDRNSQYMWVAHYKGIQYYDCQAKTWNDIPELQCDYAAAAGIYPDPFDSDKVYFSFYYGTDANTKKVSSQIAGADTSIFEYSKSAKTVTPPYVIDANNKGVSPQMGKTSANTIWVSKGSVLYRYDLTAKSVVEQIDMNAVIPEKVTPPANCKTVTIDFIRNVIAAPSAKTVIATVGCNIQYATDLIAGTPSTYQKKNYVVRVTESATPPSAVDIVNISAMNAVDDTGGVFGNNGSTYGFYVRGLAADPSTNGKTMYMALSNPGTVLRSTDGAGASWSVFSTDGIFNQVKGIALDGKGNLYGADGYFVGQNIAADFQVFGLCAWGGGMSHDNMAYTPTSAYSNDGSYIGPYSGYNQSWWSSNGIRGVSQMEPMMFMLLDGFYMGEARLGTHKSYPSTGSGGHVGHMTVFEPKCSPFAPRVNEPMIPANPQVINKTAIEIPILSPGLPWQMNDVTLSTLNKNTVQITDETGAVFTPSGYSFVKPAGPDEAGKFTGTGKLIISGNYTGIVYSVKLICGINGIKNIKGASLTNTRLTEFKDDITLYFGNGVDISKGTYVPPDTVTGPQKMPLNNSKVDLVVNKVWLAAAPVTGKPLTVKFQIKNIGTVKTSSGTVAANIYWNNVLVGSVAHGDLAAGAVTADLSFVLDAQYVTAGRTNTIMVKADGNDKVAEMRETNNTGFTTFLIDTRPELAVKEITLSSTKPGKTTVNFKIANVGFGPTAAGPGAQTAAVYVNNSKVGAVNYNDLAKGAVVALKLDNVAVTAGACRIKVVADSAGIVTEVNENNNSLEKAFTIK